jgi:hypothetical protein
MKSHTDGHHEVASHYIKRSGRPERFVWIVPEDAVHGGCLHAYSGSTLVGRSTPVRIHHQPSKREEISDVVRALI